MIVELHVIQNFAPANLNRSDTGSPKDCQFGGHRRARISSQCFKRAVRDLFAEGALFTQEHKDQLACRSKLHLNQLAVELVAQGKTSEEAFKAAAIALNACRLKFDGDNSTPYLVFAGTTEIQALAGWCVKNWQELSEIASHNDYQAVWSKHAEIQQLSETFPEASKDELKKTAKKLEEELVKLENKVIEGKKFNKEQKKLLKSAVELLSDGKAADLALFGRMLADLPTKNVEAACQVAHSISTHKVSNEFDFYTAVDDVKRGQGGKREALDFFAAVDDLQPQDVTGAGMMGTLEFNSACLYRYANVNLTQLHTTLNDAVLEEATLQAFLRAFVEAIPSGKQNGHAAHQKPSFVLAVVRKADKCSLANAFELPVRPEQKDGREVGLIENSILRLDQEWGEQTSVFGDDSLGKWFVSGNLAALPNLGQRVTTKNGQAQLDALIANVLKTVKGGN